jgi:hypothetical protein
MNKEPKSYFRYSHCKDCPFKHGIPKEAVEVQDSDSPHMLCHESKSLDGPCTVDFVCSGHYLL